MPSSGDSVTTEPLELYDEDVFVANLEDPAKKYADITKQLSTTTSRKTKPSLETHPEEEPESFWGSRFMLVSIIWTIVVIVVIVVAVVASKNGDSDDPAAVITEPPTTLPQVMEPTSAPTILDIIVTDAPVVPGVPTAAPVATEVPTAAPVATDAPTAAPIATEAPTAAPVATDAPTATEVIETAAPTAGATEAVVTASPTAGAVVETASPTAGAIVTASPTAGAVVTDSPTAGEVVETGAPTTAVVDLVSLLPESSQEALVDPISPQSRAAFFVNYDTQYANRTETELVQRFALATIYFGLGANLWTEGSVNPNGAECEWFAETGSTCNEEGLMQSLLLESNNLQFGPIPAEVGLLTALVNLDMSDNAITGTIPTYLGQLTVLETLNLSGNLLEGSLPTELSSIPTLTALNFTSLDNVTGTVPDELCAAATFDCRPEDLCGCDCACAAA